MQRVGHLADSCAAARVNLANLARLQLDEDVVPDLLVRDDLREGARGADELGGAVRA